MSRHYASDQDWDGDKESSARRIFSAPLPEPPAPRPPVIPVAGPTTADDWVAHLKELLVTPHAEAFALKQHLNP